MNNRKRVLLMIGMASGVFITALAALYGSDRHFEDGAIAATKGEYICKQVPQFVGEPQWQCRSVYGE